jgi:RNA polymerase sigma-B factor
MAALPSGPERDQLRRTVIEAWLPMARRVALRFRERGESLDDLRQVASIGLIKAVDRYDPDRGPFGSYAVPTIVGELKRHFRDVTWSVHVPRRVQELRIRVRAAQRDLSMRPGAASPTVQQLAGHCGLSEEDVVLALEALQAYRSLSLDGEPGGAEDGYSLLDCLGAEDPSFERVVRREAVRAHPHVLSPRERHILYLRFYREMSQTAIAAQLGVSQMHVSRLLARACRYLRATAEREPAAARRPGPTSWRKSATGRTTSTR